MDKIRVLRVIEYVGPRDAVERVISTSIHGERRIPSGIGELIIRAATIGIYPEILEIDSSAKEATVDSGVGCTVEDPTDA